MRRFLQIIPPILIVSLLLGGCVATSPFFKDMQQGDAVIINKLNSGELKVNEQLILNHSPSGSPLKFAIWGGRINLVKELIRHGADVNESRNFLYGSPLRDAIGTHNFEIAEVLVEAGASDAAGLQGELTLAIDALGGASYLYPHDRRSADPHFPYSFESRPAANIEFIRATLNRITKAGGVPQSAALMRLTYNYQGRQARLAKFPQIHSAYNDALRLLLNAGADPWTVDARSKATPLSHLVAAGKFAAEPIELLVEKAADSRSHGVKAKTRQAIRREYVNRCLPVANSALHQAVSAENTTAVSVLLKLGADPNQLCPTSVTNKTSGDIYSDRMSALQFAVVQRKMAIAKILVGLGAKTQLRTGSGKTLEQLTAISREFNERADAIKTARTAEAQERAAQEARQRQAEREQAARQREANMKGAIAILGAAAIGNATKNYSNEQRSALVDAYVKDVANGTGGTNFSATADQVKAQRQSEHDSQMAQLNALRSQSARNDSAKPSANAGSASSYAAAKSSNSSAGANNEWRAESCGTANVNESAHFTIAYKDHWWSAGLASQDRKLGRCQSRQEIEAQAHAKAVKAVQRIKSGVIVEHGTNRNEALGLTIAEERFVCDNNSYLQGWNCVAYITTKTSAGRYYKPDALTNYEGEK